VPWNYDEEAVEVLSKFTKLKCSLMPYLYHAAIQAHERGTPMMRAMILEFPYDPACDHLDRQYMLGDSLLVAPVFRSDGFVEYYLPEGRWTNLLSGNILEGPRWVREAHDFTSLPLLVRPNSVIAIGAHSNQPAYVYGDDITLNIYQLDEGRPVHTRIPDIHGRIDTTFEVVREKNKLKIKRLGASRGWNVRLHGMKLEDGSLSVNLEKDIDKLNLQLTR